MIAWGESATRDEVQREAARDLFRASVIDIGWGFVGLGYVWLLYRLIVEQGWLVAVGGFAFSILFALAVPHMLDRYATRRKIGGGE